MINLKHEKKEDYEAEMMGSDYPYGLCIDLDKETLKKLGMGTMSVGSEIKFTAKSYVKGRNEYEGKDEEVDGSMSLQITDMEIDSAHDSDVAKKFYGDK